MSIIQIRVHIDDLPQIRAAPPGETTSQLDSEYSPSSAVSVFVGFSEPAHETAEPKQKWSAKQEWRSIFGTTFPD